MVLTSSPLPKLVKKIGVLVCSMAFLSSENALYIYQTLAYRPCIECYFLLLLIATRILIGLLVLHSCPFEPLAYL